MIKEEKRMSLREFWSSDELQKTRDARCSIRMMRKDVKEAEVKLVKLIREDGREYERRLTIYVTPDERVIGVKIAPHRIKCWETVLVVIPRSGVAFAYRESAKFFAPLPFDGGYILGSALYFCWGGGGEITLPIEIEGEFEEEEVK